MVSGRGTGEQCSRSGYILCNGCADKVMDDFRMRNWGATQYEWLFTL